MRLIQINLFHCKAAQDLLVQRVKEEDIEVAIISEHYRVPRNSTWITDGSGTAAIWICGSLPFHQAYGRNIGFVSIRIK